MVNAADIAITSLETINAFDIVTGKYKFTLDELQDTTIANTEDSTDVTGKGGRILNTIKRNKAVTISGNNGLVSGGLLEVQTGSTLTHTTKAKVLVPDYLVVADNKAVTSFSATGTAGNEIESVYIRNTNGTNGKEYTQAAAVDDDKFTYDPTTKTITFKEDALEDGTEIAAYYFREVEADVLENLSDVYSTKAALYIDAFGEDKCGNIYRIQFYVPKADFNGNFDIQFGDNQTVHAFEAKSLAGACDTKGSLWTYTIFGVGEGETA